MLGFCNVIRIGGAFINICLTRFSLVSLKTKRAFEARQYLIVKETSETGRKIISMIFYLNIYHKTAICWPFVNGTL